MSEVNIPMGGTMMASGPISISSDSDMQVEVERKERRKGSFLEPYKADPE